MNYLPFKIPFMSIYDYSQCELEPRKLNKEEKEDPYEVIHDFFSFAHLPQVRELLWEWFKLTVTGSYHKEPREQRYDVILMYEKVEKLVEAVHIIHRKNERRSSV